MIAFPYFREDASLCDNQAKPFCERADNLPEDVQPIDIVKYDILLSPGKQVSLTQHCAVSLPCAVIHAHSLAQKVD
jgi:hypothetical protein